MRILMMGLLSLLCVFAQSTVCHAIEIRGVIPNLSLILIVSYGILEGKKRGRGLGLFIGLTQDFLFFHTAGFTGLLYYYIGHLSGYFNKDFYKENYIVPLFLLAAGDLLYSLVCYFFLYLLPGDTRFLLYLQRIIIPELVYTAIFALPSASAFAERVIASSHNAPISISSLLSCLSWLSKLLLIIRTSL